MKRLALILMLSTLLLVGGPAIAEMCTIDAVPAATLLLPYFEVDLDDPNGVNTIFSINNASAAPALAHVSFWTDWSHPTIDFDVFLTGYDVQVVNLRNVFEDGDLPITADLQSDSIDTISPHQSHPQWDGSFGDAIPLFDCENYFPFYINPLVTGENAERLVNGHTGALVTTTEVNGCLGADHGDNIARGYITIDSVSGCSTVFPSDPVADGYFADGGTGIANNFNQLWGEYFIIDPGNDFAQGENLVHVEAEDGFTGDANSYTFYSRFTSSITNADNREPLGATWAARYLNNASFSGGTDFIVWRDSTWAGSIVESGYNCGGPDEGIGVGPVWFPLNEIEVVAFDEEERAAQLCFTGAGGVISPQDPADDPPCFPLETQKIASTNLAFRGISSPYEAGWMYLNLGVGADGDGGNFDPIYADGAQSYVSVSHSANDRYSVGLQAIELTSACSDSSVTLTEVCDPNYVQGFPATSGPATACTISFAGD